MARGRHPGGPGLAGLSQCHCAAVAAGGVGGSTALVLFPEKDQAYDLVTRTAKNLADTKILLAGYLNIRDLFGYEKLVLPVKALDALVATLG